jgi:hypothetical protein
MKLKEKQEEMCKTNKWDISDLKAIYIKTTLNKSSIKSHTEGLSQISKIILEKNKIQLEEVRLIDHDIALGVWGT